MPARSTTRTERLTPTPENQPSQPVSSNRDREGLHISIDGYQAEYLDEAEDVNTSELCRAAIDAVIPESEYPEERPARNFKVLVTYNGALAELAPINTNGAEMLDDE